jgi:threonine dehydratase
VAEPGGAVAVAAALFRDPAELGLGASGGTSAPVVAVVSGGNIDPTLLADILRG